MKYCIQNEQTDFACSVICSIPFVLQMKQFSPGAVFSDILQPTLAIGETHIPVQHSLASIVGDLTCVLAGSCVCLRLVNSNFLTFKKLDDIKCKTMDGSYKFMLYSLCDFSLFTSVWVSQMKKV